MEANCAPELGRGPCEENLGYILGKLVQDDCCCQGVAMYNANAQVFVLRYEQGSTAVQALILCNHSFLQRNA